MKTFAKKICMICMFLMPMAILAQNVLDDLVLDENTPNRKVISYASLRQADYAWKKIIWRAIDLREKINLPLYYPLDSLQSRKSMWDVIRAAIVPQVDPKTGNIAGPGKIPVYEFNNFNFDNGFTKTLSSDNIISYLVDTAFDNDGKPMYDNNNKVLVTYTQSKDIVQYILKEIWFFDRQRSVMDVRILSIAPVYNKSVQGALVPTPMFWVYYPAIRESFSKVGVYNPFNDEERRTFEDIIWKRQFSSYIIQESNVYNRNIGSYEGATIDAQLESDKVKNKMFNVEHDMWQY